MSVFLNWYAIPGFRLYMLKIIMMVLGAVYLFVNAPKGTEERKEETV